MQSRATRAVAGTLPAASDLVATNRWQRGSHGGVCDTLVRVSPDGVLFAKNSDRDPNESQILDWVPAATHRTGDLLRCTWIDIPQVEQTHAILVSRPWWMWGGEIGTNEHGVTIGNEAVFTDQPYEDTGLLGMDLLRLALERADDAESAVGLIIELLERHGQGGSCSHERPKFTYHNSFLIADGATAFVVETAGRRWATEQVQEGGRSISNGLTIAGFANAHRDRTRSKVSQCDVRQAITRRAAARATGVASLTATLRSHGAAVDPHYSPVNGALAAPCAHAGGIVTSTQTTASWVAALGPDRHEHWTTATSAPCTSIFKPVGVHSPVDLGAPPSNHHDPATTWWRHEQLHRVVLRDPNASYARFVHARDRLERAWLDDPPTSADAFKLADEHEALWFDELVAADLPDRRPRWLRSIWTRLDHAAGMP
jgi:secernin